MAYDWQESSLDSLGSSCSSQWDSEATLWYATAPVTDAFSFPSFDYTATSPCCSSCTIYGGDIKVYHWPTPAMMPNISVLYDTANNFTFRSPSIYVAFQTISATNLCETLGAFASTTIGFDMSELSTRPIYYTTSGLTIAQNIIGPVSQGIVTEPFTAATWGASNGANCSSITKVFSTYITSFAVVETISQTVVDPHQTATSVTALAEVMIYHVHVPATTLTNMSTWTVSYNPCSPVLSVPTKLFTLDGLFTGCVPGISGFIDPPYTLTAGGALNAFNTPTSIVQADSVAQTSSASPASSVAPVIVDPTTSTRIAAESASTSHLVAAASSSPYAVDPNTKSDPANPASVDPAVDVQSTSTIPTEAQPATLPVVGIDPETTTADPANSSPVISVFVIGSQTVYAGGPAVTLSKGTVVSLLSGGQSAVVGDVTQGVTLATWVSSVENGYIVGSQTLQPGGSAITVSGSVISLFPEGSSAVVDGQTIAAASVLSGASLTTFTASETPGDVNLGGVIASVGGFVDGNAGRGGSGNGASETTGNSIIIGTGSPSSGVGYNGTMFTGIAASQMVRIGLYATCNIALGVSLVSFSVF